MAAWEARVELGEKLSKADTEVTNMQTAQRNQFAADRAERMLMWEARTWRLANELAGAAARELYDPDEQPDYTDLLNSIETALDVAGMLPVVGIVPDLLGVAFAAARGKWGTAGLNLVAAVPGFGDAIMATKLLTVVGVGATAATMVLKNGDEAVAATAKVGNELVAAADDGAEALAKTADDATQRAAQQADELAQTGNLPPLKPIHALVPEILDYWRTKSTQEIIDSLTPGQNEALKAWTNGDILDGHHRLKVLQERGIDIDSLAREIRDKFAALGLPPGID